MKNKFNLKKIVHSLIRITFNNHDIAINNYKIKYKQYNWLILSSN